jgi:hypothetical protein
MCKFCFRRTKGDPLNYFVCPSVNALYFLSGYLHTSKSAMIMLSTWNNFTILFVISMFASRD